MRERLARLLFPSISVLEADNRRLAAELSHWQTRALQSQSALEESQKSTRQANARANFHLRQLCDFMSELVWGRQMFGVGPSLPEKVHPTGKQAPAATSFGPASPLDGRPRPIRQRQQQGIAEFIAAAHAKLGLENLENMENNDGANTTTHGSGTSTNPAPASAPTSAAS